MARNHSLRPEGAAWNADTAPAEDARVAAALRVLAGRPLVLVGLMGAGKTAIGRRLANRLGLGFCDADVEIAAAAGCSIAEFFARFGEAAFREGERRVIARLLAGPQIVLATGGGAFIDAQTRAAIQASAVSAWLRTPLAVLVRRVTGRTHRPLLLDADPAEVLARLAAQRNPFYAEADMTIDCADTSRDATTTQVLAALANWQPPRSLDVLAGPHGYKMLAGPGLLARAGALLAPVLPQKRAVVITDTHVAALHLPVLQSALEEAGFALRCLTVPPGEASKSLESYGRLVGDILAGGMERRTAIIALGGGVVGDLAGFAAASVLRGLPFVQIPTTLLAQVDSSVGGKTGINTAQGKNLVGAFYQPRMVLADTATLATLPRRELLAGYAEIVKTALIGDADFYAWCEANGAALVAGDAGLQAQAVLRACAFKAAVVADDEREEKPENGRALLNLGHSFGHALEAEFGYSGGLLHGEAVAIGLPLAFALAARLGFCAAGLAPRIGAHLEAVGLPAKLGALGRRLSAAALLAHMQRDKKMRDGRLHFVLAREIGQAFTHADVPQDTVLALLRENGCDA